MALSQDYNGQASGRSITTEGSFTGGMAWSDAPLDEGKSRLLLNYELSDSGTSVQSRRPLRAIDDSDFITLGTQQDTSATLDYIVHHTGSTLAYMNGGTVDTESYKYTMWGKVQDMKSVMSAAMSGTVLTMGGVTNG